MNNRNVCTRITPIGCTKLNYSFFYVFFIVMSRLLYKKKITVKVFFLSATLPCLWGAESRYVNMAVTSTIYKLFVQFISE